MQNYCSASTIICMYITTTKLECMMTSHPEVRHVDKLFDLTSCTFCDNVHAQCSILQAFATLHTDCDELLRPACMSGVFKRLTIQW